MTLGPLLLLAATSTASAQPPATTVEADHFETGLLANPFWPVDKCQDYINDAERITTTPIVAIEVEDEQNPAKTASEIAAEMAKREAADKARIKESQEVSQLTWQKAALAKIKLTGRMIGTKTTAYRINGRIYSFGDYISVDYEGHRFTWQLVEDTEAPPGSPPLFHPIQVINIPAK